MNGIEKLTQRILDDSAAEIKAIQDKSAAQCAEIRADGEKKAREAYDKRIAAGKAESDTLEGNLAKTAAMESRKTTLSLKQELVGEAFDLAMKKLRAIPEDQYVEFVARRAVESARTGREQIILNAADRANLGKKVCLKANELMSAAGKPAAFTLSEESRNFLGGLVLKDGDVEANCTIEILTEAIRGEYAGKVAEELFGGQ